MYSGKGQETSQGFHLQMMLVVLVLLGSGAAAAPVLSGPEAAILGAPYPAQRLGIAVGRDRAIYLVPQGQAPATTQLANGGNAPFLRTP